MSKIAGKSLYLEHKVLDHVLRNVLYTPPPAVYLALYLALPDVDGTGGTEVPGSGYARQPVTFAATALVGGGTQVANATDIFFPAATGDWGTLVGYGVFDSLTLGNILYGNLMLNRAILSGDIAYVVAGQLVVAER